MQRARTGVAGIVTQLRTVRKMGIIVVWMRSSCEQAAARHDVRRYLSISDKSTHPGRCHRAAIPARQYPGKITFRQKLSDRRQSYAIFSGHPAGTTQSPEY